MRLMVAEDSLLVRQGLSAVLASLGHEVCATAARADQVLALVTRTRPDIALLDVRLPPTFTDEGLRLATVIRDRFPRVGVLVLSQQVEPAYADLLVRTGGTRVGYLLKDRVLVPDDLDTALHRIQTGGAVIDEDVVAQLMNRRMVDSTLGLLTDRERDVLALMAQGLSDRGIADVLSLSLATVDTHVRNVYRKVQIPDDPGGNKRVSAVLAYLRRAP
jgi:DNA-binding NarL/FixJ family response regulator